MHVSHTLDNLIVNATWILEMSIQSDVPETMM